MTATYVIALMIKHIWDRPCDSNFFPFYIKSKIDSSLTLGEAILHFIVERYTGYLII